LLGVDEDAASRIDKDLKVELRETAFQMWMACYGQDEIAETIGYSRQAVGEFMKILQDAKNSDNRENGELDENTALNNEADSREFDDDEEPGANGLGGNRSHQPYRGSVQSDKRSLWLSAWR